MCTHASRVQLLRLALIARSLCASKHTYNWCTAAAAFAAAGLSEHPAVAFLAQQLLAEALACGSNELLQQQLSGVLQLLQAASACAALPGADPAFDNGTQALVDIMSAVLQVCLLAVLEEHVFPTAGHTHTLSTGPFLQAVMV